MERQELHFVNFVNPEEDSKRRENRKLVRTLAMKDAVQKRNRLAAKEKASKSPISDQQGQSPTMSEESKGEKRSPKEEGDMEKRTRKKTPRDKLIKVKEENPKRKELQSISPKSAPEGINVKRKAYFSTEALPSPDARRHSKPTSAKLGLSSKRTSDALSPSLGPSSKAPRLGSPREITRKGNTLDPFDTLVVNPSFEELAICGTCKDSKRVSGRCASWPETV